MSAWLDDRRDNPVKFPHIPFALSWAVGYQRDRCRRWLGEIRGGNPNGLETFPLAWRDYRGLMARVGALNANRRKEQL